MSDNVTQVIGGPGSNAGSATGLQEPAPLVRSFHQILLWPLQLLPLKAGAQIHHHREILDNDPPRIWKEVDEELCADPEAFQERHSREFVTFLPYVQRLLYGEGANRRSIAAYGVSPIKAYRRSDVAAVRIAFRGQDVPVVFDVRDELKDMGSYLDSDLLRRQSNIFLRLTVVTMIGLIRTTTTGFLGLSSLIAATDHRLGMKVIYIAVTAAAFAALTLYTLAKSQRIAVFLDALTNERLSSRTKLDALLGIWSKKRR